MNETKNNEVVKVVVDDIVKINPADYGLNDETALNIKQQFQPMLDTMVELEKEFNIIINLPIEAEETSKRAEKLLKQYVKVRTGTADIHKNQKAFYLNGGRFVDGWKNAQLFASQGKEEKLKEIKEFKIRLEAEKVMVRQKERIEKLLPFLLEHEKNEQVLETLNLGQMPDDVFDAYLQMKKTSFEEIQKANEIAEQKRIDLERKKELHNVRKEILLPYWNLIKSEDKYDFSIYSENEFNNILTSLKNQQQQIDKEKELLIEQQKQAEIEKNKALELQKQKDIQDQKRSNELKLYLIFIRDYQKMLNLPEAEYQKELSEIKIAKQQHDESEAKKAEALKKEKEIADKKIADAEAEKQKALKDLEDKKAKELDIKLKEIQKKNDEKQKQLQAELDAKKEAELLQEQEAERQKSIKAKDEQERLKLSEKKQLELWINQFTLPETAIKSEVVKAIMNGFELFKQWAIKETNKTK